MKIIPTHTLERSHGGDLFDNVGSGFASLYIGISIGLILNENFWEECAKKKACYSQGFDDGFKKSRSDLK